jgi:serine protease
MKQLLSTLAAICISIFAFAQKPQTVPGELIVQLLPGQHINNLIQSAQILNGQLTELRSDRLLSPQMRAYLVRFNPQVNHNEMLRAVFDNPAVSAVQFNHVIENRIVPDDPQLGQQWQHINDNDADVDSDLAWDITTGGLTALGDTIVVCIVDDGTKFNHPDLLDNQWVNYNEIPDNNIDDDANGYVDDYLGWNPVNDNDAVDNGSHGVNVAGMVGARGDNATGVVGVNWNVKLMTVTYGNLTDASVIESYTYPLTMRQLYEQSGGTKGAFVVATNSSWGINNGDPADAPLWCAFYDTLGAYGILSAGATANAQINVDVNGDLPTACSSNYMISVTATNNADVRTFSGYGLTTIDLGAPGEDVRTTSGTNGYTTTSGTSFATPMVAGAIALLYAAPCASLAAIAHADPELAAQFVRQYLLDGVDVVQDLVGYTVTGGRLNLRGALDQAIMNCSGAGCIGPLNVNVSGITDSEVTLSWASLPDVLGCDVRYGIVGDDDTLSSNGVASPFVLGSLTACADYWVNVRASCETDSSAWSNDRLFTTDGCCLPPATLTIGGILDSSATATWGDVLAAQSYVVQWREVGTQSWLQEDGLNASSLTIENLDPCSEYEVQVATNCANGTTEFTSTAIFRTLGCGSCTDLTFCTSSGTVTFEWIADVNIGDLSNNSSGVEGYSDYTDLLSVELRAGETYPVSFTPGFANNTYTEHFRVWIDLNQNGTFTNATELLFDDEQGTTTGISGTMTIPENAQLGSARMRVSMAYGAAFGGDYPQDPCDNGQDGEVEDYCVNILEPLPDDTTGIDEQNVSGRIFGIELFPVPTSEFLNIRLLSDDVVPSYILLKDVSGRQIMSSIASVGREQRLNVSLLRSGVYLVEIFDTNGIVGRGRFLKS